jgi:transcriptional regulator with XRE-family HTH domain
MKAYNEEVKDFFETKGPEDVEKYVEKNVDIASQIVSILDKKGWNQSDLAKKLGKSESEISKWLSGVHNLTLKSIAKMEAVLGEDIIITPKKAEKKFFKYESLSWIDYTLFEEELEVKPEYYQAKQKVTLKVA